MDQKARRALAYLIGVALGDGNLSNPNGRAIRLRVTCATVYPGIAKEIISAIGIVLPKNKISIVSRKGNCFDVSVYSNKLAEWMPWRVGKGSKITQHARVPEWIREDSVYSKECLRGLFQTDGCLYLDRGYEMAHFTNNILELADDVKAMLENLGFRPTIAKVLNGKNYKYLVRVARKDEIGRMLKTLSLHKT